MEASGKPLKKGNNDPESNVREHSIQPRRKDDIESSAQQVKKANTESKATKGDPSGIKSKTEVKGTKEKKEIKQVTEEKVALVS